MSINNLYRRHIASNEANKGLLQALLVLGDKIEANTGTHPDAAKATFDPHTGEMILNEKDYNYHGNLTSIGDLIEEMIERLDGIGGGGGGGGSASWGSISGTLASQTDLQNALNAKTELDKIVHPVTLGFDQTTFADNTRYYFGKRFYGPANNSALNVHGFRFAYNGQVKAASLVKHTTGASSSEAIVLKLRDRTNNLEYTLFNNATWANNTEHFDGGLSIAVSTANIYDIVMDVPALGTNGSNHIGILTLNVQRT